MHTKYLTRISAIMAVLVVASLSGCSGGETVAPDTIRVGGTGEETAFDSAAKAAFDGDLSYVKQCVESDARYVEGYDGRGRTLLHYAAEGGHEDIVKYLLENGARANAEDNDGYYPLDAASQGTGSKAIMDLLMEAIARERGGQ